jgi:hypothetical protein
VTRIVRDGITIGINRSTDHDARTRELETPELRDTLSPVEVRLTRFVRERMQDECWRSREAMGARPAGSCSDPLQLAQKD